MTRTSSTWRTDYGIKIYEPKKLGGYWRVIWKEAGATRETTAISQAKAFEKATKINLRLAATNGDRSLQTVEEMIRTYLDPIKSSNSRKHWRSHHSRNMKQIMELSVIPQIGKLRCSELKPTHLQSLVSAATTPSNAEHLVRALSALINWAHQEDWILSEPKKLTLGMKRLQKNIKSGSNSKRPTIAGEGTMFVDKKEIPSHAAVDSLAKAAAKVTGIWWHELLINLAAYSGMRNGEIFDLDYEHINFKTREIRIETQRLDDAGNISQTTPKWDTVRKTTFPVVTPQGYKLAQQLRRRLKELEKLDQTPLIQDGTSRLLLFPNSQGGWESASNYSKRVRIPAQKLAQWPIQRDGKFQWTFHSLRHVFCSYLINDLKCDPIDVSIAAGHKSYTTTLEMYVGRSEGAINRLQEITQNSSSSKKQVKRN
jgi:integrase